MPATAEDAGALLVRIEASQAKFERQMAAIAKKGADSATAIENQFKKANDNVARGFDRGAKVATVSLGQQQAAAKNLAFQLNDIATQLASGTSPFRVLAQQGGQVVQILNETGGARGAITALGGAFGGLLNPIGLATIAIGALGAAALTYFTSSEEDGEKNNKVLDDHRAKIRAALDEWGSGAPQAVVDYANALDRIADFNKKMEALTLTRDKLTEPFREAKDEIQVQLANIQMILQDFGVDGANISNDLRQRWNDLAKAIAENKDPAQEIAALIAELGNAAQFTGSNVSDSLVKSLQKLGEVAAGTKDQLEGVNGSIERMNNNAVQSINSIRMPEQLTPLTSGAGVFNPSQTQLQQAEDAKREAEQAAKEAARAAEQARKQATREAIQAAKEAADRLSKAVATQTSVAVDAATAYLGQRETTNRGSINAFLKAGGVDLDAATTAWCAAFVNSSLAQVGVSGSGSNVATSFLNWGNKVDPSQIQRGDVLVQDRGLSAGQTGGHVGFATGQIRFQQGVMQLQMLSGNASNKVSEDWVNAIDVVARRATEAVQLSGDALKGISEQSKRALESQTEALKQQQKEYEQLGQIAMTAMNGLVNALADGKLEGKELLGILVQVVQQILMMPNLGGGGGGLLGSLFGGLGSIFGFANGGIAAHGRPQPLRTFANGGISKTAAIFGETGRAEAAVPLPDGRRIPVDLRAPEMPRVRTGANYSISMPVEINAPGADAAALARVERSVKDLGRNIPKMVDQRVDNRQTRKVRA